MRACRVTDRARLPPARAALIKGCSAKLATLGCRRKSLMCKFLICLQHT